MQTNVLGLKILFEGHAKSDETFLLSPRDFKAIHPRLIILDSNGRLIKSQVAEKGICADFRQIITPAGNTFYTYNNCISHYKYGNGWYENVEIRLLDENLNLLPNKFKCIANGSVEVDDYPQCHDNLILDENHYYLNINKAQSIIYNDRPIKIINNIIQEVQNNRVVWQFETADYPELLNYSVFHAEALKFGYADFAHINSIAADGDNYLWVSFRNIGIAKIAKNKNKILWICGEGSNQITFPENFQAFKFQHDLRLFNDEANTFSFYDNVNARAIKAKIEDNSFIPIYDILGDVNKNKAMGGCIFGDNYVDICSGILAPKQTLEQAESMIVEHDLKTNKPILKIKFLDTKLLVLYRMARGKK